MGACDETGPLRVGSIARAMSGLTFQGSGVAMRSEWQARTRHQRDRTRELAETAVLDDSHGDGAEALRRAVTIDVPIGEGRYAGVLSALAKSNFLRS